jgi:phosphoribosyl 1,2-cyclic phosphodiesterase
LQEPHGTVRVEILGTRGNIPASARRHCRHAGVLVDETILLDLGEWSYLRRHPRQILITHLHPDHAAFLATRAAPPAEVYLPQRSRIVPAATIVRGPLRIGAHRIVPVPTVHATNARSLGYIVERGRRRVFYSSDMISIDRRYYPRLGRLDLVISDGSFIRRGGLVRRDPETEKRFGHAGIPDLVAFFRRFTSRIVFTHFGSWFYADVATSVRTIASLGDDIDVTAAWDGMVLDI